MEVKFNNFEFKWPGQRNPLLTIPDWTLNSGCHVLIWGESGKGKTTLLHCMGGLLNATEGKIMIDGIPYRKMMEKDRQQLRRESITLVFQRLNLIKHMTTLENVMLGINGKQGKRKVDAIHALQRLRMDETADRLAWNLSAGEQQRVALARALVRQTPLILADEPTANLDYNNAVHAIEELLTDVQQHNHTLVVVSHDERIRPMFNQTYNIEEISD